MRRSRLVPLVMDTRVVLIFGDTVVLLYDALLTISREVDCVWKRKFSVVTFIFFIERYCMIVLAALRLYNPQKVQVRPWCYPFLCSDVSQ